VELKENLALLRVG